MIRFSVVVELADHFAVGIVDEDGNPTNENCVLRTNNRNDAVGEMELWKKHSFSSRPENLPKRVFFFDEVLDEIIAEFSPVQAMAKKLCAS